MRDTKRLLAIFLHLPQLLEKSSQMLALKYLARLGWEITVLTVGREQVTREPLSTWNGIRIVCLDSFDSRAWGISRSLYRLRSKTALTSLALYPMTAALSFPDRFRWAVPEITAYACRSFQEQRFDAVLSLFDPMSSHVAARAVSRKLGIPWVAMIKDYFSKPAALNGAKSPLNSVKGRYEKAILRQADLVFTVNDDLTAHVQKMIPRVKVGTLSHCYDEEEFQAQASRSSPGTEMFTLVSVGQTGEHDRLRIQALLESLVELREEGVISNETFSARFVGHGGSIVQDAAPKECQGLLDVAPPVPHDEALREMTGATCLFFSHWPGGSRRRLAEYLGAKRPILVYPAQAGTMSHQLLESYGGAIIAESKGEIKAAVTKWYRQFRQDGEIEFTVNEEAVERLSARRIAETLAADLDALTATSDQGTRDLARVP